MGQRPEATQKTLGPYFQSPPSLVRGMQDTGTGQVLYSAILGAIFHGTQNAGNVFPPGDKGYPLTLKPPSSHYLKDNRSLFISPDYSCVA